MPAHLALLFLLASATPWSDWITQAVLQEREGRYQDAERSFRQALQAAREEQRNPRELALTLNNLGGVQLSMGDYLAAEKNLNLALQHCQRTNDAQKEATAAWNHLAILYRRTGRLKKAEAAYRRILAERLRTTGTTDASVARVNGNLAAVLMEQKRFQEAAGLLEGALQIFQGQPELAEDQATVLANLAVLHSLTGDRQGSTARAAEAVAVLRHSAPSGHPRLGMALLLLGEMELHAGRATAAEAHLRQSAHILQATSHPALADALLRHADALRKCGRKQEAKLVRQQASSLAATPSAELKKHQVSFTELQAEVNQ